MATGLMTSLAVSFIWVISQIVWMHVKPASDRFGAMLRGFLVSLPVLGIVLSLEPVRSFHVAHFTEPYGVVIFHAVLVHTLTFVLYVECFYHLERAVTIRMLIEIAEHEQGITLGELRKTYAVEDMVATRADVLARKGFVVRRGDSWHLTTKGLCVARMMQCGLWIYQAKSQLERD